MYVHKFTVCYVVVSVCTKYRKYYGVTGQYTKFRENQSLC